MILTIFVLLLIPVVLFAVYCLVVYGATYVVTHAIKQEADNIQRYYDHPQDDPVNQAFQEAQRKYGEDDDELDARPYLNDRRKPKTTMADQAMNKVPEQEGMISRHRYSIMIGSFIAGCKLGDWLTK